MLETVYITIAIIVGFSTFIGFSYEMYKQRDYSENEQSGLEYIVAPFVSICIGAAWPIVVFGGIIVLSIVAIYVGLFCLFKKFDKYVERNKNV